MDMTHAIAEPDRSKSHRKILHLDLDAFFCAVEERRDPSLRGKPFAVGGRPDERGVIASCSYAARRFGVRSAMPTARALRLCPDLIILPGNHASYHAASQDVMQRLKNLTPRLEQVSIDEAFLDISDLPEPGEVIARQLQETIRRELDLPCSLGVAANKLVAKIATDVGKAANRGAGPPNAITVVPPGKEVEFLAPLPVIALWGVGPKTAEFLAKHDLHSVGDIQKYSESELIRLLGKLGYDLFRRARGLDDSPVESSHETKSISQETTFARDVRDGEVLRHTLREQSESVGRSLRKEGLSGATVKLKLRWPDFTTLTRQMTLPRPTDQDVEIYNAALELFTKAWILGKPVRLIGVGVSRLSTVRQLGLWEEDSERQRRLQKAVDTLRDKYGDHILKRGEEEN